MKRLLSSRSQAPDQVVLTLAVSVCPKGYRDFVIVNNLMSGENALRCHARGKNISHVPLVHLTLIFQQDLGCTGLVQLGRRAGGQNAYLRSFLSRVSCEFYITLRANAVFFILVLSACNITSAVGKA